MKRKQFIKYAFSALIIPFGFLWKSISDKKIDFSKPREKFIKLIEIPNGISFFDTVIINKSKNEIKIFSSKCSHLGCKISKIENDKIVCPCHGSKYSFGGEVLKGPSTESLKKLPFEILEDKIKITIG